MCKPRLKIMGKFLTWILSPSINAITLAPIAIFFRNPEFQKYPRLVNHEEIHWRQQIEMLFLFFYIWYGAEWIIRSFVNTKAEAYYNLSFEREAYQNDDNLYYLEKRKCYSWIKYLIKKSNEIK